MRLSADICTGFGIFLLVLGLAGFGGNNDAHALQYHYRQGNLIGYSESAVVTVLTEEQAAACGFGWVSPKSLLVRDHAGNVLTQTTTGSQVVLEVEVASKCVLDKSAMIILEVRGPDDDVTNYLTWQEVTINSKGRLVATSSWVAPEQAGEYQVRAFSFSHLSLQNPMVLQSVLTYKLTVLLPANVN